MRFHTYSRSSIHENGFPRGGKVVSTIFSGSAQDIVERPLRNPTITDLPPAFGLLGTEIAIPVQPTLPACNFRWLNRFQESSEQGPFYAA